MHLIGVLTEHDTQSCDWGDCDEDATATRWAEDLGEWLSICANHERPEPC